MKLSEEIFAIKLYELEQQFGKLQSQLYICQQQDHSKIKQQLQNITDEYLENELLLKKSAAGSRSSTVTLLAVNPYARLTEKKVLRLLLLDIRRKMPS